MQALIAIQQSSNQSLPSATMPPPPSTTKGKINIKPALQVAAMSSDVRSAALHGLQSLALLHSSKDVHIFSPANIQQLLQPSLVFLPEQQKGLPSGKGSPASRRGKAGAIEGKKRVAMGKAAGSAALGSSVMTADMHWGHWSLARYADVSCVLAASKSNPRPCRRQTHANSSHQH